MRTFVGELSTPLLRHHKGMKIAMNGAFSVGEGLVTLPGFSRNLFSKELDMTLSQHHKGRQ
jgi:hypothetical protein